MKKFYLLFFIFLTMTCFTLKVFASEEETLIIFDASVSMLEKLSGQAKYQIAIKEAKAVLDTIPESKKIGLRTIGITLDSALLNFLTNPDELCKATQLTAPIRANNNNYIKSGLDTIFPLGTTPLVYTLETAINYDFTKSAYLKHIILITDGAESCNGDPCNFIQELMKTRKDIKIDVIAINVNDIDYKQLKCLTDNTSGQIINVSTPTDIKSAFTNFLSPKYIKQTNTIRQNQPIIYKNYLIEVLE